MPTKIVYKEYRRDWRFLWLRFKRKAIWYPCLREGWLLVERYFKYSENDWRLVFKRDDGTTLEITVPEEVWRAFDGLNVGGKDG